MNETNTIKRILMKSLNQQVNRLIEINKEIKQIEGELKENERKKKNGKKD